MIKAKNNGLPHGRSKGLIPLGSRRPRFWPFPTPFDAGCRGMGSTLGDPHPRQETSPPDPLSIVERGRAAAILVIVKFRRFRSCHVSPFQGFKGLVIAPKGRQTTVGGVNPRHGKTSLTPFVKSAAKLPNPPSRSTIRSIRVNSCNSWLNNP